MFLAAISLLFLPASGHSAGPEAAGLSAEADPVRLSRDELLAGARALRDAKQFDRAAALARAGLARFPEDSVWELLLALILIDAGKAKEALIILASSTARAAPEKEYLLAQAYAERRAGHSFDALRHYFAVLARDPGNTESRDAVIAILREIRAPFAAARLAGEPPPALAADMAAAEVRWDPLEASSDPRRRFDAADRAIADLDRLITQAQREGDTNAETHLRLDHLIALRDRVRMAEVIAEADALRAAGTTLPPYDREALADALLYMRRPQEARTEYEAVLQAEPGNRNAAIGRFYAAVEMEDFATAYAQADALLVKEPVWQRYRDDPGRYPNDDYVDALIRAALARFYGSQPDEAWKRLAPEREAAPANPSILVAAASIMSARGWPRAAEEENRIALSLAPSFLQAQIGVTESALARNRFEEARTRTRELSDIYPEQQTVRRLVEDLDADTGWQVEAEIRPSNERGGGEFGNSGNELTSSVTVHSPFVTEGWRLFGGYAYSDSHPPEGFVDRQTISGGAQLVLPDVTASAALTQTYGSLSRTGFTGMADWMPTDHATLALSGERISSETPLRALLNGITADSLSSRFTYAWDEGESLSTGAGWMTFTDGNQRVTIDSRYQRKLVAIPHFGLTLQGELYGSANSGRGAPYYNPASDGSAILGLMAEHTVWRRYENSFVQALTMDCGPYGERGFKGGTIGTARYEHRWRFDPRTELVYGVSLSQRMYDGEHAHDIGGFITLREKI